jgi:hypothetical protein
MFATGLAIWGDSDHERSLALVASWGASTFLLVACGWNVFLGMTTTRAVPGSSPGAVRPRGDALEIADAAAPTGGSKTFKKTWLTHDAPKASLKPKRSVGTLRIDAHGLSFESRTESWTISTERLKQRGFGKSGSDFVNKWVKVGYVDESGKSRDIYLNDGRFLGWGGVLGGAKKIDAAVQEVIPSQS